MAARQQDWNTLCDEGLATVETLLDGHLLRAYLLAPDPARCVAVVNRSASHERLAAEWQERFEDMLGIATLGLIVCGVHGSDLRGPGIVGDVMAVVRAALASFDGNADIDFWGACFAARTDTRLETCAALVGAVVRWQAKSKALGRLLRADGLE